MYWHKGPPTAPEAEYLVRTTPRGAETSLGPRTAQAEEIYSSFHHRKATAEERLKGLTEKLKQHKRLNRALRVGRVPPIVVDLLNCLEESSLASHFRVVGTHAIYAYEAAAGVMVESEAVATQDIDLLWDVRKRVSFATELERLDSSMIGLLRKVDKTFKVRDSQKYTAVNKEGFEVDILRREVTEKDPHPIRLSPDEDDFWVTQAKNAGRLIDAPSFSAIIVATNGDMARMNTLAPMEFVRFKRWMSELHDRDRKKALRDRLQAATIEALVNEYLPNLA